MPTKYTTEYFIARANKKHNNKYDYSLTEYKGSNKKLEIICPVQGHGAFVQRSSSHLDGDGCPYCGKILCGSLGRRNTKEFIDKSKELHGDLYRYDKVEYSNSNKKVSIWCNRCGKYFYQIPYLFLSGYGCASCQKEERRIEAEKIFIEKAKKKHKGFYSYEKVKYISSDKKVKATCPIHGIFTQEPSKHLSGSGCKECMKDRFRKSLNQFILDCKKVHGKRYNYSKVIYTGDINKVEIICRKHGSFWIKATNFLQGQNCPKCKESKLEIKTGKILTKMKIQFISQKKFKDCKNKRSLLFDFYLSDHNIAIECQGIQHYESVDFFGGHSAFIQRRILDMIKFNYCKISNINLIEIPYWEIKNIEKILEKLLID